MSRIYALRIESIMRVTLLHISRLISFDDEPEIDEKDFWRYSNTRRKYQKSTTNGYRNCLSSLYFIIVINAISDFKYHHLFYYLRTFTLL